MLHESLERGSCLFTQDISLMAIFLSSSSPLYNIEQYHDETDTWEIVGEMPPTLNIDGVNFSCFSLRMTDVYAQVVDIST